jgi:hypothetical protein
MDPNTTDTRTRSKYGKVMGRPPGRRDSDIKKTLLGILAKYRIPEMVMRDFEKARKEMTPRQQFEASCILLELGLKAAPKDVRIDSSSTFTLQVVGLGLGQRAIQADYVPAVALPTYAVDTTTEIDRIRSLPSEFVPNLGQTETTAIAVVPEPDERVQREMEREHERIADDATERSTSPATGVM